MISFKFLGDHTPPAPELLTPDRKPRVLIVEDEIAINRAVTIALTRRGFEVLSAHGGNAALAIIREKHVDVMVTDLRMDDLRGDVMFHIAVSWQPHLKRRTIFITGDITEQARKIIEECRCPLVRKPFDLWELVDMTRDLLPEVEVMGAQTA
jgi:DNA-binding NtrC family response regulator